MDTPEQQDPLLTVAEVAGMLRLNQQTVRNWIDQGSLPAFRVGRRVRIKRSDFERILEQSYTAGAGPGGGAGSKAPSAADFWGGTPVGVAEPPQPGGESAPESGPRHGGLEGEPGS